MIERLVITGIILVTLAIIWLGWRWIKAVLVRSIKSDAVDNNLPTLLYFSADYCAPCKLQQTPIIDQITEKREDSFNVKKIDVSVNPDMASHYKVITLPTTVILNPIGDVVHVNYGVTPQTKLESQLLGAL